MAYALQNNLTSYGSYTAATSGGTYNVTNAFVNNGNGGCLYMNLAITSSVPITLGEVNVTITNFFTSINGSFNQLGLTYDYEGIGIGTNGQTYTTGNANTPVYQLYVTGIGIEIDYTGYTFAQAVADNPGSFQTVATYSVFGQSATSSATLSSNVTPTPEPGTISFLIVGILGICFCSTKEHRTKKT
jgi:hypothetical protein